MDSFIDTTADGVGLLALECAIELKENTGKGSISE
jgi:hypothetical protein